MHQKFYPGSNLSSYCFKWQFHPHQHHRFHTGNHISGTVGMCGSKTSVMTGIPCLYMDSLCSHHAEIQYLYSIYTVYNVIILPFHSCKKKRAPFTALFHIDFLIHLSYSTVLQPMSLNFFPKMG